MTILGTVLPEASREELQALSIGQRDAYLCDIREQTFGSSLACVIECPSCHGRLEFSLDVVNVRGSRGSLRGQADAFQEISTDGYTINVRLPTHWDLQAIAGSQDVPAARKLLVERCVLQIRQNGVEVPLRDVPERTMTALAEEMADHDPGTEVQLDLRCPVCEHGWEVTFDILSFLWAEICALARRLLCEVHTLARAYGWREADILSMSAARRRLYLDMVAG